MTRLQVSNGLDVQVDDEVYERLKNYPWILKGGKPYLAERLPAWKGSRSLHRHVAGCDDPNLWVLFRDGWTRNCQASNLFVGTPQQCMAYRNANPISDEPVPISRFEGVIWSREVRAWTIAYEKHKLSNKNPQFFANEADAAHEFDRLTTDMLNRKSRRVADLRERLIKAETELTDEGQKPRNFPVAVEE